MKIAANASSTNISPDPSDAGTLAKLQKRLQKLMKELKGVASENLSPKAKEEKSKLLQAEIQVIQAQIAAIERKQLQASELKIDVPPPAPHNQKTPQNHRKKNDVNIGLTVDTYA